MFFKQKEGLLKIISLNFLAKIFIFLFLYRHMIHVYTGNGKGKTTAAFGLALRALGNGMRVFIVQFMKGGESGEVKAIKRFENASVLISGTGRFLPPIKEEDLEMAREGLKAARDAIKSYDMVILDEINVAVHFGLIEVDELLDIIRRAECEVILTGRYADRRLIEIADYVTIFQEMKHPYAKGIKARKGIEF
jgi:cob(I)alamin adenosyltransferase